MGLNLIVEQSFVWVDMLFHEGFEPELQVFCFWCRIQVRERVTSDD